MKVDVLPMVDNIDIEKRQKRHTIDSRSPVSVLSKHLSSDNINGMDRKPSRSFSFTIPRMGISKNSVTVEEKSLASSLPPTPSSTESSDILPPKNDDERNTSKNRSKSLSFSTALTLQIVSRHNDEYEDHRPESPPLDFCPSPMMKRLSTRSTGSISSATSPMNRYERKVSFSNCLTVATYEEIEHHDDAVAPRPLARTLSTEVFDLDEFEAAKKCNDDDDDFFSSPNIGFDSVTEVMSHDNNNNPNAAFDSDAFKRKYLSENNGMQEACCAECKVA